MSVMDSDAATEAAPDGDEGAAPAASEKPSADVPFTSLPGFPHKAVHDLWKARVDCGADATKTNRKAYKEAREWFRGGKAEWRFEGADSICSPQLRVSANAWYRMVTILISHLSSNDPRVLVEPAKGVEFEPFAKAAQKLAQAAYREQKYRLEIQKALVEAILRNRSYVFQGWDSHRWLPTIRWCEDEVYIDPDSGGDLKNAQWVAEQYTAKLDTLLNDDEITDETKELLRTTTSAHVNSRDRTPGEDGAPEAMDAGAKSWDAQPGFKKVVAYKVYSREGLLPGGQTTEGDSVNESEIPAWMQGVSPFRGGNDRPNDASPESQAPDPIDAAGRRVQLLLVKGIDRVIKAVPWHMDHFDRDEFPYVRLQFSWCPDDPDGVTLFQIMRPLFIAKNGIISFAMADSKLSAQRRIGIDETVVVDEAERAKITNGKHLEAYLKRGPNGVTVDEFGAKNPTSLNLLPEIDSLISDTSGVTDVLKGQSGAVEKTKAEAIMLNDSANAALAYLENPFEVFNEDVSRLTVMAEQRYIKRATAYEPCPMCAQPCAACDGLGEVDGGECDDCCGKGATKGAGQSVVEAPMEPMLAGRFSGVPLPCPCCQGSGWAPGAQKSGPLRKGADWWLSTADAAAWRDDLSLEQIRSEVIVSIEAGSTRRDYRERRVGLLNNLYDRLGQEYRDQGLQRPLAYLRREMVMATELPNAEAALPTPEEDAKIQAKTDAMQQAQLMQAQAAAQAPPQPDPQQIAAQQQAEAQAAAQAQQQAQADQAEKQARVQIDVQAQQQKAALEQQRLQLDTAERAGRAQLETQKLALEAQKIALDRERLTVDSQRFAQEAALKAAAHSEGKAERDEAKQEQAAATPAVEAVLQRIEAGERAQQQQLSEVLQAVGRLGDAVVMATASVSGAGANAPGPAQTIVAALEEVKRALAAPLKINRDRTGRIEGASRDMGASQPAATITNPDGSTSTIAIDGAPPAPSQE